MSTNQPVNRLDSLQVGRFLAAFTVVLLHVNAGLSAPQHFGGTVPVIFEWGKIGVDYFFVLSGFIITLTLKREPGSGDFAWHRAVRIYPAFWLAFFPGLLVAALLARHLNSPVPTDFATLLRGALLIPQSDGAPVIGVAWSLHHELLFYAVALLWTWKRWVAYLAGGALLLGSLLPFQRYPLDFLFFAMHWEFLFGIVAARGFRRLPTGVAKMAAWGSFLALVGAVALYDRIADTPAAHAAVFGTLFAVLIASLAKLDSASMLRLRWPSRGLARLGDSSYTLYLWHVLIAAPLVKAGHALMPGASTSIAVTFGLGVALSCVAIAHFIYSVVEKPLTRTIQARSARVRASFRTSP